MSPAETAVRDIYFSAQKNLNLMLAACHSDDERAKIREQYAAARHNFNACTNKAFQDADPELQDLVTKACDAAKALQDIQKQLGDITKVISAITTGVTYGSAIVGKIIAA